MATLSCPYCPVPKNFIPSDINYILCKFHLHQTDKEVGCDCKYCVSKKLADNDIPQCRSLNIIKLQQLQTQLYKKDIREEHTEEHTKEEHRKKHIEDIESLSSGLEIINISQSDENSDCQSSNKYDFQSSNQSNVQSNVQSDQSDISVNNDSTDNEIVFVQSPMESFLKLNYLDE